MVLPTASRDSVFNSNCMGSSPNDAEQLGHGIVELIDHALLEWNDGVVGDGDALGAHLGAALGDVAETDPMCLLEIARAVRGVERMHLECRRIDEVARADELVEHS